MLITVKGSPQQYGDARAKGGSLICMHKYLWNPGRSKENCRRPFCQRILMPLGRNHKKAPAQGILLRESQPPGTEQRQRVTVSLRHGLEGRASLRTCPPAMQDETGVRSLDPEALLEYAAHSNILAWRIPWTEEPARLQSWTHRVRHN